MTFYDFSKYWKDIGFAYILHDFQRPPGSEASPKVEGRLLIQPGAKQQFVNILAVKYKL